MRAIIVTFVAVIVLIGFTLIPQTTTVTNEMEVSTSTPKIIEVDALEKAIEEAQDKKRAEIETIAKQAYDEAYDYEMKKVELEVIKSFDQQLEERQIQLEKETGIY